MIHTTRARPMTLGPQQAGQRMTAADFEAAPVEDGYRYELVEGVLHVSPAAEMYHGDLAAAIADLLRALRGPDGRPVFARVRTECRVFVDDDPNATTNPEPDVAAYLMHPGKPARSFRGVYPVLVVEIVSADSSQKDYIQDPRLYGRVPAILEYWIVDATDDLARPTMTVYRRDDGRRPFERIDVPAGGHYECARWPGLKVDLHRIATE